MIGAYNPFLGQILKTNARGVNVDRSFLAHYILPASAAIAADDDYIVTATPTTNVIQNLDTDDFAHDLATPKVLSVKSVTVGQTGDVAITGTDQDGKTLTETIAINDSGSQSATKVFATVTGIELPAAVYQTGTVEVLTAADTQSGNITVTVTAAVISGAQTTGNIALLDTDTIDEVAAKIAAAIDADATIGAAFDCTSDGAIITLKAKAFSADDNTYNITITDGGGTGATVDTYVDGDVGIPSGNVTVGVLGSFGIPYALPHDTVVKILNNNVVTTVAAGSNFNATDVNENYIQPTAVLAGNQVDVYFIV